MSLILLATMSCFSNRYAVDKGFMSLFAKNKKEENTQKKKSKIGNLIPKRRKKHFTIDWSDIYRYKDRPNFVKEACNDILLNGLFEEEICKFLSLLEKEYIVELEYIWVKCSKVVLQERDILIEVLRKLISSLYVNDNRYCIEVINTVLSVIEEDKLVKNAKDLFIHSINFRNIKLAEFFLILIKENCLEWPEISEIDMKISNSSSEKLRKESIEVFNFWIDKGLVKANQLKEIIEIISRISNIELTLKLLDIFKENENLEKALVEGDFFSQIVKSKYNEEVMDKIYLNFDEHRCNEMIKIIKSLFLGSVNNHILVILSEKIYDKYGEEFLIDILEIYKDMDNIKLKKANHKWLGFMKFIKGRHGKCRQDIREILRDNYIKFITSTECILREVYISDLWFFLGMIKELYEIDKTEDKKEFLDRVNYIDEEGRNALFIGSNKYSKENRISTILFGESFHLSEDINRVLRNNVSKLSNVMFGNLTYHDYNRGKKKDKERVIVKYREKNKNDDSLKKMSKKQLNVERRVRFNDGAEFESIIYF